MPRKEQGWVTFQTSEDERKILEEFCEQSQRTKTEILRELVRSLNQHSSPPISLPTSQEEQQDIYAQKPELETNIPRKSLKVSSRNILKGVVKRVVYGAVNSEVTIEIIHKVELTSIITRASAEELELAVGKEAYAVIKSNDIVIARE
ncbi:MAG: molybdopterin-binding protein [Nostoc sp. SerVER01]|uniref:TOBE domain-containing protein n=1 Tax=Nostoc sp. CCY 9925 TaxID=3103865 RepID=UPI002AD97842|nr:molybdopterin-binding protein [Nostoc sp. SerVER01]MDZ8028563.1 molybdopterin-binding protein [Nostoc sp. DedQUE11]MDZ8074174.1 molybdopterin-binding protein [Nostoc sp. DedQUE01]MDZ8081600.1 molybdopterin-binding protein [Nostoc sp. DcaGUA01]MDZ8242115.1 molybdopterin-binding protein [Nostoc sp. ChiQUE01a]